MGSLIVFRDLVLPETAEAISGLVLSRERNAYRHWVFGTDEPDFRSIAGNGEQAIVHQGAPTVAVNYVTVTSGTSLRTEYFKANEFSVFLVGRRPWPHAGRYYFGNFSLDELVGLMIWTPTDGSNRLSVRCTATARNHDFATANFNGWFGIGLNIRANGVTVYCPQLATATNTYTEAVAIDDSINDQFFIGGRAYDPSNPLGDNTADVAEVILFDSALSTQEMQGVYSRSVTRMATRGITLA